MGIEALFSTQIIDTTAVGRAVMTAADAAAARTAIGAGTSSFSGAYSALTGIPSTFAPSAHKATHATGQPDALSPSDIGAVPTARTLTINGTAFDLSADRSWTVPGGGGGISSLNGLTDATQTFQTGTTGTNFGIVSTAGVHTFNLPDASATARGVVTTGAQTFAGAKTFSTKVTVPATGNSNGGIGNGANGIDFAGGINTYVSGGGYPTFTSAQSFRLAQNARIEWSGNNDDAYTAPNTRIERWENGHVSVRFGVISCKLSVTNSFTDVSNYERAILQFVTYASARYAQLACESAGTGIANMNLVLSPKGTGALIVGAVPDGTTVGGNARGNNAVDLYTGTKGAATQVASGNNSFLGPQGGTASGTGAVAFGGTASGNSSFVFPGGLTASGVGAISGYVVSGTQTVSGQAACAYGSSYSAVSGARSFLIAGDFNTVSGDMCFSHGTLPGYGGPTVAGTGNFCTAGGAASSTASWALSCGQSAQVRHPGQRAFAAGRFSAVADAQGCEWVLRNKTTDGTTAVTLFLDGSSARLTIPSGKILSATAQVVGSKSDGTAVAIYTRKFAIKNVGGTTTLVGSVETIGTDVAAGTSLSITADDTNDAVNAAVIGVNGETWRWAMTVYGVELAYGT